MGTLSIQVKDQNSCNKIKKAKQYGKMLKTDAKI